MDKLIAYFKSERGRMADLARKLEITSGAIKQWSQVPADKVVAIEKATGIPRQELRPDLYEGMSQAETAA